MIIDRNMISRYNLPVPRYTSYPPASSFKDGITEIEFINLVKESNHSVPEHISFYVHIPFCTRICYYCGCNACKLKDNRQVKEYTDALLKEIDKVSSLIEGHRKISQIHFGGGTPNSIDVVHIEKIVTRLVRDHRLINEPEIAIECNPAWLDYPYLDRLLDIGFNRLSFGIQDFNAEVLRLINRQPSKIEPGRLLEYIHGKSPGTPVNLDFIYGLPGQSLKSFSETIKQAAGLKPDRLVTFSYAHVPWLKKHQRILDKKGLPRAGEKLDMFLASREILVENGYKPIGLDHYVLPSDDLYKAYMNKQLHRNFQGYCTTKTTGQVYAFGVSSISQLHRAYIQNVKDVPMYIDRVNRDRFPLEKGYVMSDKDLILKDAITGLMCNGFLDFKSLAEQHRISVNEFKDIAGVKDEVLAGFIADELIEYDNNQVRVTGKGSIFIRNIAASFDPGYVLQKNKYSQSV